MFIAGIVLAAGVLLWALFTLMSWVDPYPPSDITLVEVVRGQVAWVWRLLHRVW